LTSTTLLVDNEFQPKWVFEESFVDVNHVAATCRTVLFIFFFIFGKYFLEESS